MGKKLCWKPRNQPVLWRRNETRNSKSISIIKHELKEKSNFFLPFFKLSLKFCTKMSVFIFSHHVIIYYFKKQLFLLLLLIISGCSPMLFRIFMIRWATFFLDSLLTLTLLTLLRVILIPATPCCLKVIYCRIWKEDIHENTHAFHIKLLIHFSSIQFYLHWA